MSKSIEFNKYDDFSSWYHSILAKTNIIDKRYPVKGMNVFTPNGWFLHQKIMDIIEQQWTLQNIQKVQFPLVIPKLYLTKEAEHVEGFTPEVFWLQNENKEDSNECALRPTSETAMYSMFSLWLKSMSYTELPLKVHQTCAVYRNETKDTMPLIRAREIHWNEVHTCHSTKIEAIENLEQAWVAYNSLLDCIGVYGLRLIRPVWDKFAGAEYTEVMDCVLPSGKVLQTVGAHYLGQKFAKAFDVSFTNNLNQNQLSYMTCYGISTRVLACVISAHSDSNGLVLPLALAKYYVVIIPANNKKEVLDKCVQLSNTINVPNFIDYNDKGIGDKHYYWELMGVPFRVIIGDKEVKTNNIQFINRIDRSRITVENIDNVTNLMSSVNKLLFDYDLCLKNNSKDFLYSKVVTCHTIEEIGIILNESGGFIRIPYYSDKEDGKEGEKMIKELFGAEIRGFVRNEVISDEICAITGKTATCWAYIAKSY